MTYIGGNCWDFFTEAAKLYPKANGEGRWNNEVKYKRQAETSNRRQFGSYSPHPYLHRESPVQCGLDFSLQFQAALRAGPLGCSGMLSRTLCVAKAIREIKDKLVTPSIIPDWCVLFSFCLGWRPSYSFLSPSPFSVWIQSKMSLWTDTVVFWHWETEVFCFSTFFPSVPCGSDITLQSPILDFRYRIQNNILYEDPAMICSKDFHILG